MRAKTLTSASNPLVRQVRRAVARGETTAEGLIVAETHHLVEEALRSSCEVAAIIAAASVSDSAEQRYSSHLLIVVDDRTFESISGTESNQGVMALVRPHEWRFDEIFKSTPLVVILDGVQDPGNAGAIVRAADAFGGSGVVFLKGSVNPHNPKAVRASAGSIFRVPYVYGVLPNDVLKSAADRRVPLYAAIPRATSAISDVPLGEPCAFVIGSEGRGISSSLEAAASGIYIPTEHVESLNAAIAAAILLYEARRQRSR